ncbi:MAG: hypothetical protein WCD86_18880 [Ktedonobacteraceae bacterium]
MPQEKTAAMPSAASTTYFADTENAGEMARLLKQARFATQGLGGLLRMSRSSMTYWTWPVAPASGC